MVAIHGSRGAPLSAEFRCMLESRDISWSVESVSPCMFAEKPLTVPLTALQLL